MIRPALSRRSVSLAFAITAAAGLGVGTLSACSSGGAPSVRTVPAAATEPATPTPATLTAPTSSTPTSSTPPTAPTSATPTGPLTADQASSIAVQASPGTVTDVEQDTEATGPVFDVTVQHADGTETKVEVDATTGQIISTETDPADQPDGSQ